MFHEKYLVRMLFICMCMCHVYVSQAASLAKKLCGDNIKTLVKKEAKKIGRTYADFYAQQIIREYIDSDYKRYMECIERLKPCGDNPMKVVKETARLFGIPFKYFNSQKKFRETLDRKIKKYNKCVETG